MTSFVPEPQDDPALRPPEQFVPAVPFDAEEAGSTEPPEQQPELQPEEVVSELTDEERQLFSQLLTCGQRSKTIDVMGHSVSIQSLRVSDELRIGLHCRPYESTKMEQRAFQVAVCAAGIRTIDGNALYQSLEPLSEDALFDKKADALKDYYPIVITKIYRAVMDLDQEFAELAMKLGKLSG